MRRILFVVVAFVLSACTIQAERGSEPVASQSSKLTSPIEYAVGNGELIVPQERNWDSLCPYSFVYGTGAHSASPLWPNGKPKLGAAFEFQHGTDPLALHAFPYGGSAIAAVRCYPASNFADAWGNPGFSGPELNLIFRETQYGQGQVSASLPMWESDSVCYLRDLGGLSSSLEEVNVYRYADAGAIGGARWGLSVIGTPKVYAFAQCAYLGRAYTWLGMTTADSAHPDKLMGMAADDGACFLAGVSGSVDDGSAAITIQADGYHLKVTGQVKMAKGYCVRYANF